MKKQTKIQAEIILLCDKLVITQKIRTLQEHLRAINETLKSVKRN